MKRQEIVILSGIADIEEKINQKIREYNQNGWYVKQITSHACNQSKWCLLFEKEVEVDEKI